MCIVMKEKFSKLEEQLKNLIEKKTLALLGISHMENTLAQRLVEAMEAETNKDERGQICAPNIFNIYVSPKFAPDVRANEELLDSLAKHISTAGENAELNFSGEIQMNIFPDSGLNDGEFGVAALWKKEDIGETRIMEVEGETGEHTSIPAKAFLIIEGTKIIPLDKEVINIGRMLTNDLVLDDPRVSRNHAQLRAVQDSYMLFDLDSSGGTFVNDVPVRQTRLYPGDVISLAGVPLVYGQDAFRTMEETQEYQTHSESDTEETYPAKSDGPHPGTNNE